MPWLALLAIEHGIRIATQSKTRSELDGNFWGDYRDSLHWPKQAEPHTSNRIWRASLRLIFNPTRAMSDTAAAHLP